jgi:hypothetical protein
MSHLTDYKDMLLKASIGYWCKEEMISEHSGTYTRVSVMVDSENGGRVTHVFHSDELVKVRVSEKVKLDIRYVPGEAWDK